MKKVFIFLVFACFAVVSFYSCSSSSDTVLGDWKKRSDLDGVARSGSMVFTINGKAYLVSGQNWAPDGIDTIKVVYEFDPVPSGGMGSWIRKKEFPGTPRHSGIAFNIGNYGYVGLGTDGNKYLNDIWRYDPANDTWTQMKNFPGSARCEAVGFSIGNAGYVSSGWDGSYLKDFWQYDPSNDTWTSKASYGGSKRRGAMAFVINDKAYICGGMGSDGTYVSDFWQYDPATSNWTQKRDIANTHEEETYDDDYTNIIREYGAAFVINGKAYVSTGRYGSYLQATWEYDPKEDLWNKMTPIEGAGRYDAVGFSINNRGFIATGTNGGTSMSSFLEDIWEFFPTASFDISKEK